MARTIEQIKNEMQSQLALEPGLSQLNSNSKSAIYNLWMYIVAYSINIFENILDKFKKDVDSVILTNQTGVKEWVKAKSLEFQYDSINPQILVLNKENITLGYENVDTSKRIITQCSVVGLSNKIVLIKLAKGNPSEPLDPTELDSFRSYFNAVGFVGIEYYPISVEGDKIMIDADIYYNGQYASTIQNNVIQALENYFYNVDFDSSIKISKVEDIIQEVEGVNDIVINNLIVRPDSTPFANINMSNYLVKDKTTINRIVGTYSGYAVEETESGYSFADKLNFIAV